MNDLIDHESPLLFTRMMTTLNRPVQTFKTKTISDKTKKNTITTEKTIDPLEKRLNHIRIHILNNKKQQKLTHTEPTLVFDKFLYLGGIQSLHDKVSFIFYLFCF